MSRICSSVSSSGVKGGGGNQGVATLGVGEGIADEDRDVLTYTGFGCWERPFQSEGLDKIWTCGVNNVTRNIRPTKMMALKMATRRTPFRKQKKAPHRRNGRPWWGGGEGECHRGKNSETMGGSSERGRQAATCGSGVVRLFEGK